MILTRTKLASVRRRTSSLPTSSSRFDLSSNSMAAISQLDHLILLVPSIAQELLKWLSSAGFDLIPGGQHADGLTENVLISLTDGVCT